MELVVDWFLDPRVRPEMSHVGGGVGKTSSSVVDQLSVRCL